MAKKLVKGKGIVKDIKDGIRQLVHGRDQLGAKSKRLLKMHEDKYIVKVTICRQPIDSWIPKVLNVATLGEYKKILDSTPYDKLYHTFFNAHLAGGTILTCQKNESVEIGHHRKRKKDTVCIQVPITSANGVTFGETFNNLQKGYRDAKDFYGYNAIGNNCQRFVSSYMLKNPAIKQTPNHIKFIKQDIYSVLKSFPQLNKFNKTLIDVANRLSTLQGKGIIKDTIAPVTASVRAIGKPIVSTVEDNDTSYIPLESLKDMRKEARKEQRKARKNAKNTVQPEPEPEPEPEPSQEPMNNTTAPDQQATTTRTITRAKGIAKRKRRK